MTSQSMTLWATPAAPMNQGTIIEMGTHQELLDRKGFYADLYNSQFLGKQEETK